MGAGEPSLSHRKQPMPDAKAVMARVSGENFPVASRLLGRRARSDLLAIYGFARLCDEIGDSMKGPPTDRLAALDWLAGELDRAYAGCAEHPLMVALQRTLVRCALPRQAFVRLIEANRADQTRTRYETWEQLRSYCHLSADPIGELVLCVFGCSSGPRIQLSDEICTALQLTEHCQDVAEDLAAGRIYLPAEDMRRFDCRVEDLSAPRASSNVRALIAFQVRRAHDLLSCGGSLVGTLSGRSKLAVAAFIGGGRAALGAIERVDYDVLANRPRPGGARSLLAALTALRQGRS